MFLSRDKIHENELRLVVNDPINVNVGVVKKIHATIMHRGKPVGDKMSKEDKWLLWTCEENPELMTDNGTFSAPMEEKTFKANVALKHFPVKKEFQIVVRKDEKNTSKMGVLLIDCQHCKGTGECGKGRLAKIIRSCAYCAEKSGVLKGNLFPIVPCQYCGGKGYHLEDLKIQKDWKKGGKKK